MSLSTFVQTTVFFKCPKRSWVLGKLESWEDSAKAGICRASEGNDLVRISDPDDVHPLNDPASLEEDVNDLLLMSELHDSTLLHCLQRRYMNDVIYTNIGAIVVALNPFNFKIPRYMDTMMKEYLAEGETIQRCVPHSWACAHNTYYELRNQQQDQCILVSGESGAGKTEASKIVMKYLAAVSCLQGQDAEKERAASIGKRINLTSLPLEAFGNAKTVRNDNSSRFGKFMKVRFDNQGFIVGAHITKYLLEKSRIITASKGERIYHAFYLLLKSKDAKSRYQLEAPAKYKSANAGATLDNKEYNTAEEFEDVCQAMRECGIAQQNIDELWNTVAGVLHMENVEFLTDSDGCFVAPSSQGFVANATKLWGVDKAAFDEELVTTTLTIMGKPVKKMLNCAQAADGRAALSKAIYDGAFTWLVEQCNAMLDAPDSNGNWIGLLDIFGFEDFQVNSFEQLCINLTNEALQNHYNTYIFCKDVDECRSEGIDVSEVPFPDNSPCLHMITNKGGILSLLDEECQLGSGTDGAFLMKIADKFSSHQFFEKKKTSSTSFIIKHYAGDVTYQIKDFREKNLDTLKDAWKNIIRDSQYALIKQLLPAPVDAKGPKVTVGGFFKKQLGDLMEVVNATNPHWIRCIKPHPAKKPLMFDGPSVMNQLSSSGVLGTVKIRKAGYAVRIPHANFVQQFKIIPASKGVAADCQSILSTCGYGKNEAQIGTHRVFLRSHIYMDIEGKRKAALAGSADVVQAFAQSFVDHHTVQKAVLSSHQSLVQSIRQTCHKLIAVWEAEQVERQNIIMKSAQDFHTLDKAAQVSVEAAKADEEARWESIRAALAEVHARQQDEVFEVEAKCRADVQHEYDAMTMMLKAHGAEGARAAMRRQALREHQEAESRLMVQRREIRETRRTRQLDLLMKQSASRVDPTVKREHRMSHAQQVRQRQVEERIQEQQGRAFDMETRQALVLERRNKELWKKKEKMHSRDSIRLENASRRERSEIAFERYQRVMAEDFKWQQMERQLLEGQRVALEEQRRQFLRDKAEQDAARRKKMKEDENESRHQKLAELSKQQQARKQAEERDRLERQKEERKIFAQMVQAREAREKRAGTRKTERSIAWENDRKERIALQRPDIPRDELLETPLRDRVGPPTPFVMTNGSTTTSKLWIPFKVVKLEVTPSNGVEQGMPFSVSWLTTRMEPQSYIIVNSGVGEIARYKVHHAVEEQVFCAPDEWFSELEISFMVHGKVEATTTLPKISSYR